MSWVRRTLFRELWILAALTCAVSFPSVSEAARSQTHVVILIDVSGSMVDNFDWPSETSQVNAAKWRLILAKQEYLARIGRGRELIERPASVAGDLKPEDARTRRRLVEGLEGRRGENLDREIARLLVDDDLTAWKVPLEGDQRKVLIDEVVGFWNEAPFPTVRDRIRFDRMRARLQSAVAGMLALDAGRRPDDPRKAERILGAARKEAEARNLKWDKHLEVARKTEIAQFVAARDELVADRATSFLDQFVEAASPAESSIKAWAFSSPSKTGPAVYRPIEALDFSRVSFSSGDTNLIDALRLGREKLLASAREAGNLGRDLLVIWLLTDAMHDLHDSPEDREKRQYHAFINDLLRHRDFVEPVHFPIHQPPIEGATAAARAKNYSGLYSVLVLPPGALAEREQLVAGYRELLKRLETKTSTPGVPLNPDPERIAQALTLSITSLTSTPEPLRSGQSGRAVVDIQVANASRDFDFSRVQITVEAKISTGSAAPRTLTEQRSLDRVRAGQTERLSVPFTIDHPSAPLTTAVTVKANHGIPIVGRYNVPWFPNPEMSGPLQLSATRSENFRVTRSFDNPPPFVWVLVAVAAVAIAWLLMRLASRAMYRGRPSASKAR